MIKKDSNLVLEYGLASRSSAWRRRVTIAAVVGLLLAGGYGLYNINRARDARKSTRHVIHDSGCSWRMREVGSAIAKYAHAHDGELPPSLEQLIVDGSLSRTTLRCPAARPSSVVESTDRQVDSYKYVYVGAKLTIAAEPGRLVMYEELSNHGDGSNVLFMDGHVEFLSADAAKRVIELGRIPDE